MYNLTMRPTGLIPSFEFPSSVAGITAGCSKVTSPLFGNYDDTMSFLTDEFGFRDYSITACKAVTLRFAGKHWDLPKAFLLGLAARGTMKGKIIKPIVGSTIRLAIDLKDAFGGFERGTGTFGAIYDL